MSQIRCIILKPTADRNAAVPVSRADWYARPSAAGHVLFPQMPPECECQALRDEA